MWTSGVIAQISLLLRHIAWRTTGIIYCGNAREIHGKWHTESVCGYRHFFIKYGSLCHARNKIMHAMSLRTNFNENTIMFIQGNVIEYILCKMGTILFIQEYRTFILAQFELFLEGIFINCDPGQCDFRTQSQVCHGKDQCPLRCPTPVASVVIHIGAE